MRAKAQNKNNLIRQYFLANVKTMLIIHQQQFKMFSTFKNLFFILGQFQNAFFYIYPCAKANKEIYDQFLLVYLARPDQIFIDQKMLNVSQEFTFLIPLCLFIIFEIIILQSFVINQFIKEKKQENIHSQMEIKGSFQNILISLKSYYSQLLIVYLYIPFQILSMNSLYWGNQQNKYEIIVFSILTLIIMTCYQLIRLVISNQTLDLQSKGFERLYFTKADFLRESITLAQIILFCILDNSDSAKNIQGILFLLNSFTHLLNVFYDKTLVMDFQYKATTIFQLSLISLVATSIGKVWELGIYIAPILVVIGLNEFTMNRKKLHQQILIEKNLKKITQFLAIYLSNIQSQYNKNYQITDSIIIYHHKLKCKEIKCNCQIEIPTNTDDPMKVLFLTDKMKRRFVLQKMKHWNKLLNSNKDTLQESYYVHYISTLNLFGFSTLAFQECNKLLTFNAGQHRGFLSHSEVSSYSQGHQQQSFPSQTSESLQKQNQTKLQEINAKSIEKQSKMKLNVKQNNLSSITFIKLKILSKEIKLNMQNNFLHQQTKQQEEIAEAIELFLISEQQNQSIKQQVIKCFQQKLQFYNVLTNKKEGIRAWKLFHSAKIISNSFYQLEKQLLEQYSQFPSQKIQSVNCFIQSELLNNYLIAYKLSNFSTISDEKLINMKKNLKFNLFGKTVMHMITHIADNLQTLMISSFSNGIHQFFSLTYEQFCKVNKSIDFLLPPAIKNEHYMLVQRFVNTGKSKYFRNVDISFLSLPNEFILPFNMNIDILLTHTENLSFAVFFEEISITNGFLLVDVNGFCGGISMNIFEKIGWRTSEIKQFSSQIVNSYLVHINQIIPEFLDQHIIKETKLYNISMMLLSKRAYQTQQTKSTLTSHDAWKLSSNLQSYRATITVFPKELYGYYYYVIEIEDIRMSQTLSHITTTQNQESKGEIQGIQDTSNNNILDFSDIDAQSEAGINKPQSLNIFQQSFSEIQKAEDLTFQFHQLNQGFINTYKKESNQAKDLILKDNQEHYNNYEIDKSLVQNNQNEIINQSVRKLIDTSKSFGQQKFFNLDMQELDQSNSKFSENAQNAIKNVNQLYEVDLDKIDKEMRENIKLQLQLEQDQKNQTSQPIDDAASQVSSLIGLKKSIFYKKYELMNRLIQNRSKPTSYKISHSFLALQLLFTLIFSIIVLINLENDFNKFIQEVDMLLFSYSFMTPFDTFLSLRFSTAYYSTQLSRRLINQTESTTLSNWLSSHLGEGYDDMKSNFLQQFSNPQLQDFFINQYFSALFMKVNQSVLEERNLTFRESLNVLLQYQYQFKIAYVQKVTLLSQAFTVYPYANYLSLHVKFDNLTNEILQYTKQRTILVEDNWLSIWIPFLIIDFIFVIISYFGYKNYLQNYENFLNLFKYADEIWMDRDMERYKILISILTKDSDVMFKYQFDLEQKEKFMMAEKYKKEQKLLSEVKKKKLYKDFEKLPTLSGLVGLALVFAIFFICSLLIQLQTNDYLYRYNNTADVYKFMGDLCFQCPGLFSQRQFLYWWSIYYLPVSDKPNMTDRLFQGIDNLKSFDEKVQQFNEQDYLTTSEFVSKLESLTQNPVCNFFEDEQKADYQFYCDRSFDGALQRGLTYAFTYAANQYEVNYQLNNYSSIVTYYKYEAEGMYVLVKGLIELVQSLKVGLLSATHTHMDTIVGISVSLIIVQAIIFILQYFILNKYYTSEFDLVRRYMLLLPSSTLLLDDNFERRIRVFYTDFQI